MMTFTFKIKVDIKAEHILMLGYAFKDICNYIDDKNSLIKYISGNIIDENGNDVDFTEEGLNKIKVNRG